AAGTSHSIADNHENRPNNQWIDNPAKTHPPRNTNAARRRAGKPCIIASHTTGTTHAAGVNPTGGSASAYRLAAASVSPTPDFESSLIISSSPPVYRRCQLMLRSDIYNPAPAPPTPDFHKLSPPV